MGEVKEITPRHLAQREFMLDTDLRTSGLVKACATQTESDTRIGRGASFLAYQLQRSHTYAGIHNMERACMILLPPHILNAQTHLQLAQIPLYFAEVRKYVALSESVMREREKFARQTGFLLLGPDECLAAVAKSSDDRFNESFLVFENNDLGQPRKVNLPPASSLPKLTRIKKMAYLSAAEMQRAMTLTHDDLQSWCKDTNVCSPAQFERHRTTLVMLKTQYEARAEMDLFAGSSVRQFWADDGGKHVIEALHPEDKGWQAVRTGIDSSLFGVWANPKKYELLVFYRGEVTQASCAQAKQFEGLVSSIFERFGLDFKALAPQVGL